MRKSTLDLIQEWSRRYHIHDGNATPRVLLADIATKDHDLLTGLTDDDHTHYFLLVGRSGGQTGFGGTGAGEDLTLQSTANATKGSVVSSDNFKLIAGKKLIFDGA